LAGILDNEFIKKKNELIERNQSYQDNYLAKVEIINKTKK
jgi:hypothetical protein